MLRALKKAPLKKATIPEKNNNQDNKTITYFIQAKSSHHYIYWTLKRNQLLNLIEVNDRLRYIFFIIFIGLPGSFTFTNFCTFPLWCKPLSLKQRSISITWAQMQRFFLACEMYILLKKCAGTHQSCNNQLCLKQMLTSTWLAVITPSSVF